MIDNILKWSATAILIVGTGINSLGYYPLGPLVLCIGGVLWTIISIRWKEPALIVTNSVMLITAVAALIYTNWLTIASFLL